MTAFQKHSFMRQHHSLCAIFVTCLIVIHSLCAYTTTSSNWAVGIILINFCVLYYYFFRLVWDLLLHPDS